MVSPDFKHFSKSNLIIDTLILGSSERYKAVWIFWRWEKCLLSAGAMPGRRTVRQDCWERILHGGTCSKNIQANFDGFKLLPLIEYRAPRSQTGELPLRWQVGGIGSKNNWLWAVEDHGWRQDVTYEDARRNTLLHLPRGARWELWCELRYVVGWMHAIHFALRISSLLRRR